MFEHAKEFFRGNASLKVEKSGEFSPRDLQVATAVILIDMACKDASLNQTELETIVQTMEAQFGLTPAQAADLLEIAVAASERRERFGEMIELINSHFDENQRQLVLACVWKVVLADGHADRFETEFATELRTRLNLPLERALMARKMAETGEV